MSMSRATRSSDPLLVGPSQLFPEIFEENERREDLPDDSSDESDEDVDIDMVEGFKIASSRKPIKHPLDHYACAWEQDEYDPEPVHERSPLPSARPSKQPRVSLSSPSPSSSSVLNNNEDMQRTLKSTTILRFTLPPPSAAPPPPPREEPSNLVALATADDENRSEKRKGKIKQSAPKRILAVPHKEAVELHSTELAIDRIRVVVAPPEPAPALAPKTKTPQARKPKTPKQGVAESAAPPVGLEPSPKAKSSSYRPFELQLLVDMGSGSVSGGNAPAIELSDNRTFLQELDRAHYLDMLQPRQPLASAKKQRLLESLIRRPDRDAIASSSSIGDAMDAAPHDPETPQHHPQMLAVDPLNESSEAHLRGTKMRNQNPHKWLGPRIDIMRQVPRAAWAAGVAYWALQDQSREEHLRYVSNQQQEPVHRHLANARVFNYAVDPTLLSRRHRRINPLLSSTVQHAAPIAAREQKASTMPLFVDGHRRIKGDTTMTKLNMVQRKLDRDRQNVLQQLQTRALFKPMEEPPLVFVPQNGIGATPLMLQRTTDLHPAMLVPGTAMPATGNLALTTVTAPMTMLGLSPAGSTTTVATTPPGPAVPGLPATLVYRQTPGDSHFGPRKTTGHPHLGLPPSVPLALNPYPELDGSLGPAVVSTSHRLPAGAAGAVAADLAEMGKARLSRVQQRNRQQQQQQMEAVESKEIESTVLNGLPRATELHMGPTMNLSTSQAPPTMPQEMFFPQGLMNPYLTPQIFRENELAPNNPCTGITLATNFYAHMGRGRQKQHLITAVQRMQEMQAQENTDLTRRHAQVSLANKQKDQFAADLQRMASNPGEFFL